MDSSFFEALSALDSFFWGHIAFVLIMGLGIYLTVRLRFFQVRSLPGLFKIFIGFLKSSEKGKQGVHPLQVFFASVGGMIGIGNIVGIVTALQIGGPGALIWVWIAGLFGSIIKYAEIYLGLKHRIPNDRGGYDGGPLYFLKAAFNRLWIPVVVAILLCIYGVEIYQFTVLTDCLTANWGLNRTLVIGLLLALILFSSLGGVRRLGKICAVIMPFFVLSYVGMSLFVILQNGSEIPSLLALAFKSAFTGHAALGGFIGSSAGLAIQHGISRAAYSSDLGIGYDSIIQSESTTVHPEKQASLAILGVALDNFVCTMSLLLVLASGLWAATPEIHSSQLVQASLALYFPYMDLFMPIFLLVAGYTTIIAYFCVGLKCSRFLSKKYGEGLYVLYGACSFLFFSFFDSSKPLLVMSISGSLLLIFNLLGIFRLRDQITAPVFERASQTTD